ncbi:MAG: aminotransferase class V-fold PLP-dependent enzyme [Clostridia bacterium]|nr:aminotransferase class V-fold PLP-dependent enzyme [Clostridia bacterium]
MIYFDNGASSHPKPQCVVKAVGDWLRKNASNPGRSGHRLSMEAAELVYNTRVALGDLFGVEKPENVILVPNATYALNTVLLGLFEKGDHIITTDLEHNSVLRPLWHLQSKGVEVSVIKVDFEDDEKTIEKMMRSIRSKTKAIVCTQCSNICGRILPIERIAERKPKDVLLIVDGSQGAGTIPINMVESGVDYYCAPSHKGLLGPQGGGLILINNRIPRPLIYGGTGTESLNPEQPLALPEHLESGTLPTAICAGMLAAANYIKDLGRKKIHSHKRALTDYAYDELRAVSGVELYMYPYASKCLGVIPLNMNGKHSGDTVEYLDQKGICTRGGIHCAPLFHLRMGTQSRGMVRISFGCFNNDREVDQLVRALKNLK